MNKEVLALISKMPETGFVPNRDNVVVFGDRFFGLFRFFPPVSIGYLILAITLTVDQKLRNVRH
ncbi:hypothetical protein AT727_08790 [Desulfitobacterium hafniense]|uniref:Uncharacterized protein n=1 Tax=Desulfitobacterium hafniense TaxID=49338 RepID=A0A0W1JF01_DESHA|nr:hypothetical protein AT727_08790 [Desulfitobacterium hafniense]